MRIRLKALSTSPPLTAKSTTTSTTAGTTTTATTTTTSTATKLVAMHPDSSPRSSVSDSLFRRELSDHYVVLRQLGSGTYGRVVLARCRLTDTEVALKLLPKASTRLTDFLREFNASYYLSPHAAILNTYDVSFETRTAYVFAQECAPAGDLFEAIAPQVGVPERQARLLAAQLASAIDFMHSKRLVHRDVKPENVMLFGEGLSRVKLADFGMTKCAGTVVRKVSAGIPYTPPEVCAALRGERYIVSPAADVWALAVLLFCALTGNFPWALAQARDVFYAEFGAWQRRKSVRVPAQWTRFTPRMLRLFRRMLEPRPERRCSVKEVLKYVDDVWAAPPANGTLDGGDDKRTAAELEARMRKRGVPTQVTSSLRERRISDWILNT